MDDITRHGNIVRFALDETFLRADTMTRLAAIEKMLQLGLITTEQAIQDEQLAPNEAGDDVNDINL
jgi:prophage DNA circulation protein